ncbi:uncharacterized protein Tco025E_09307 [Trypanosoma conorhini]|uniref:Uncharacterized protein n=1 Tax=Trypanosoma conorhini TaxID=83891 RepID=A0A3R7R913_9TRYP|nr:uncharacterized protein Tco025E_09307 [Trypanosoma conorhini]RNE98065.1 hypothetical protein Tco025E_09307 [Trypanosoma conorhini]
MMARVRQAHVAFASSSSRQRMVGRGRDAVASPVLSSYFPFADANTQSCPTHKAVILPTAAVLPPLAHRRQYTPSCPPRQIAHAPSDLELALVPCRRLRGRVEHFRQLASEAAESKVERALIAVQRPVEGIRGRHSSTTEIAIPGAPIKTRRLTSNNSGPLVRCGPPQPPLTIRHTRPTAG